MQRIKSVRWPARNIGGDRAYCKLRYTKGAEFPIPIGQYYTAQNQAIAIGASTPGALSSCTLAGVMGETPNLSTMGALYTKYRIRGIKLRLTYWQTGGAPAFLYANATPDQGYVDGTSTAPNPDFILPSIAVTPEQRWSKYRVCSATAAGGRATSLSVYYSVNRVQGPDAIVKNDLEYTGDMLPASPYFATGSGDTNRPARSPWMQFGIGTLANNVTTAATHITGVLKVDQTVYCEFFGKRAQTS